MSTIAHPGLTSFPEQPCTVSVVGGEDYGYAPWAVKEFDVLTAQSIKAYETTCAEWWGASGPFHGWMNRHKQNLVEQILRQEEADVLGAGFMVALVGTHAGAASWRICSWSGAGARWQVDEADHLPPGPLPVHGSTGSS